MQYKYRKIEDVLRVIEKVLDNWLFDRVVGQT